jgi:hypothetical protein
MQNYLYWYQNCLSFLDLDRLIRKMLMQPKNIICRYKKLFGHEDGNQHSANRQNHLADILVFILLEWWINACRLLWIFFRLHQQESVSRMWNMCSSERNSVQTDGTAPCSLLTNDILRWRDRVWGRHVRMDSPVASKQLIIWSLLAGNGQANDGPRWPYAAHRDNDRSSRVA